MTVLDYRDKEIFEAVNDFIMLIEDNLDDYLEYEILTNDPNVQGEILKIIDQQDFDHSVSLQGKIKVSIGKENDQEMD